MIYTATITSASLRLRESRLIADLLLKGVSKEEWDRAILEDNVLQMDSEVGVRRFANQLRKRLEPLGEGLWQMVRDGGREQATQAAFAGAVKHSRILGDFMDLTIREQRSLFAKKLEYPMWTEYIGGCRGRDPDTPPILLLHGFPTSSHLYRNILPQLAKTHRAIALDLPGYGLSDKPLDVRYDYDFYADVLDSFLDALGIGETNLVVHDLGGPVGLYWAIQNPGRIPKLVILNTLVYPETSWVN